MSITNNHANIEDMERGSKNQERSEALGPWFAELNALPFVRKVERIQAEPRLGSFRFDSSVRVETQDGVCDYFAEVKRSYLDVTVTRSLTGIATEVLRQGRKMLLFARYLPLPTGRRLIESGVEFVDLAGNIHLDLAPNYHWTVLGKRERDVVGRPPVQTPATIQVLFALAANANSRRWTARELAALSGVSKSKAAKTLGDRLRDRTIRDSGDHFQISDPKDLADQLLSGYRQILRPRLTVGRFRSPEQNVAGFFANLREAAAGGHLRYALSGSPAAYLLQGSYRGPLVTVFVQPSTDDLPRTLRLLPDRSGPITLLRAFGEMVFWRVIDNTQLAPPWLIYADLMYERDPRAHQAAEVLRTEVLAL